MTTGTKSGLSKDGAVTAYSASSNRHVGDQSFQRNLQMSRRFSASPRRPRSVLKYHWYQCMRSSNAEAGFDGASVFFADNVHVPGVGGDLTAPDANGDTFKLRRLADGSRHRVLKNYYTDEELRALLAPFAQDLVLHRGGNFWSASYRLTSVSARGSPGASAPRAH